MDRLSRMYVSSLPLLHSGNKMIYLCHYRRAGAYRVGRTRRPNFLLLPPTEEQVYVFARVRVYGFAWNVACRQLSGRGQLINFSARSALRSGCRNRIAFSDIVYKRCNTQFYHVCKKSHVYPSLQRRVLSKWYYSPRAVGTPSSEVMRSTECTSSFFVVLLSVASYETTNECYFTHMSHNVSLQTSKWLQFLT